MRSETVRPISMLLFVVSCNNGEAIMGTPRGVRRERAVVAVCRVRVRGEVTMRLISLDRG
jgi:hypothetical protein